MPFADPVESPSVPRAAAPAEPGRVVGPYELVRLLGKSERTMSFLAGDRRRGIETMLVMPRVAPEGDAALDAWLANARRAARLDHPNLAPAAEIGSHRGWPFVAVDRRQGITFDEWIAASGAPGPERLAVVAGELLRGLAYAHDAGVVHRDVQRWHLLVDERGAVRLAGIGVAPERTGDGDASAHAVRHERAMALDPALLRERRGAAERDVLATGLLLHGWLAAAPALDEPDVDRALDRMAPHGRELVRLPWTTPQPIPEVLRAIVNRSTSSQVRLRYRSARTFLRALDGWLRQQADDAGGPIALLLDRLHTVGHLPALPGLALRVQRVLGIERSRTDEIARHLLPDMALVCELLRTLNTAQVQGTQVPGNGPVLTLRRVVALIGIDGVRLAANSLRMWPGPLDEAGAAALERTLERVRLAGHVAEALRPAGYDAEVVYLVAALQNLGRLMLSYHFADEAAQIAQLTEPAEQPGLDEDAASWAVLGVDLDALAGAVVRQWGLPDDVAHMIRRLPPDAPVRRPDDDGELLRQVASAANEAVDALPLDAKRRSAALARIAQRYGRTLKVDAKGLAEAIDAGLEALRPGATPVEGRAMPEEEGDEPDPGTGRSG